MKKSLHAGLRFFVHGRNLEFPDAPILLQLLPFAAHGS
jgi:hypothetical protein